MTDERKNTDSGDEKDTLVAEIYRETATERVPERVNRAVLKKAAAAARPRYARLRSWTRPAAWAATVVLSVALVLKVADVPEAEPPGYDVPAIEYEAAPEGIESAGGDQANRPSDKAPAVLPSSAQRTPPDTAPQRDAPTADAMPSAAPVAAGERKRQGIRRTGAEEREQAAPQAAVEDFRLQDVDMLQQAEDMARMQTGQNREATAPGAGSEETDVPASEGVSALSAAAEPPACDESVTASPDTWLECIAALESLGYADEAQQQRDLFRETYPDIELR